MRGNNFFHANNSGVALAPVVTGSGTSSGAAISEPWRKGRQITFILNCGVLGGTATWKFQVRLRGTSTWKDIMDSASSPVDITVVFTNTEDGTSKIFNLPLKDIDSDVYDAIRVFVTATHATDVCTAAYVISDLIRHPGGDSNQYPGAFTKPITYEA